MLGMLIFNIAILLLIGATVLQIVPPRVYGSALRGLHYTIGITTPTDRQLRWSFVAWLISVLVIVDGMALLLAFV